MAILKQQDQWIMGRLTFLTILTVAMNIASASSCVEIVAENIRLACYDSGRSCFEILSDESRLQCYDRAYSNSVGMPSPAGEKTTQGEPISSSTLPAESSEELSSKKGENDYSQELPVAVDSDGESEFGKKKEVSKTPKYIESTITEVKRDLNKIDYLWLENGQVWRETENFGVRYKVGSSVRIEKAVFGSHNLKAEGIVKLIKVRRVD
jgi:hypothetical protein